MSIITLLKYQQALVDEAKTKLDEHRQVGLDVFARGGKSFIAMELMDYLRDEKGCKNFLVIAPKAIINNLRLNLFKEYNNITYIGKEMLSRQYSLEELIEASGEVPSKIDAIIFDEAHKMFGTNIGLEINRAMEYIKSKYVIAMTATPYSNLKGIDALENLIRKDCILHYNFNKAVENGDINKVKYVPAVLKYNSNCYDKLRELNNNIVCENSYVVKLYEQLEYQIKSLEGDLENKIFEYIKDKICLDASEGGRVFVFFNKIEEIEENRNVIINVLKRVYEYWGNEEVNVNFYNYTSRTSIEEENAVLELVGSKSDKNTIDVIATVNKGTEGIHPSNVHFGLIMCGTQSIQRYMQLIGRITNLKHYDKNDTVIFDFRDNRSFLGKVSISVGRQKLRDRREFKRNRALTLFNEETITKNFNDHVELMPCEHLEITLDLFERVNNLMILTQDNDDMIEFLTNHLNDIDRYGDGNIAKYLYSLVFQYRNNKRIYGENAYKKYLNMYEKYNQVRRAYLFDGFTEEDRKAIEKTFGAFGYRIYIDTNDTEDTIKYIKELYEDFSNIGKSKVRENKFVDKYCEAYLTDRMTSVCYAMIQSNEKLANKMLSKASKLITTGQVENIDEFAVKLSKRLINDIQFLTNLAGKTYDNKIDDIYLETSIIYKYIKTCTLDELSAAYINNIVRYVDKFYKDIIKEANNVASNNDGKAKIEKLVAILDGYVNNYLDKLGSKNTSLDRTIAMISKTEKFSEVDVTYRIGLGLIGIYSKDKFNKLIVPKTYMAKLVDEYLVNKDREKVLALEMFIQRKDLPESLNRKLSAYNNDKITYKNCEDIDLKRAVQSLLKENNKEHVDLLRNSIRKKRTTDERVILDAFSRYAKTEDLVEVEKFVRGQDFDKKSVTNAINSYDCTIRLLFKLSESGALHKEYNDKLKEMLTF